MATADGSTLWFKEINQPLRTGIVCVDSHASMFEQAFVNLARELIGGAHRAEELA